MQRRSLPAKLSVHHLLLHQRHLSVSLSNTPLLEISVAELFFPLISFHNHTLRVCEPVCESWKCCGSATFVVVFFEKKFDTTARTNTDLDEDRKRIWPPGPGRRARHHRPGHPAPSKGLAWSTDFVKKSKVRHLSCHFSISVFFFQPSAVQSWR